ncbi:hypothetical protein FA15DRAFT_549572, partial [Coprinopsis marcescibilis]
PIIDSFHLSRVHTDSVVLDNHAQILNSCLEKLTLFAFEVKIVFPEFFYTLHWPTTLHRVSINRYEDVAHVDYDEILVYLCCKNLIHHSLKFTESEEHHCWFEQSFLVL